ncbi:GNAT family N-acetyltransferase [Pseudidiomarina woesei]|uniref:Ribosomal protein S18 acetylase RimI and related acetyltransferases n=1 Tax=Pseudidiomarina woesei TaxID=1381080 RepID=A0A0K6H8N7_9GAMM|nr:GNAT family N-acetyltransferase [Pseudidiomarina woesei]CUA87352.1 Ribosomal protein S18 acetylase RimI and related acetyltransferases [Pseudidiomarina woesei]
MNERSQTKILKSIMITGVTLLIVGHIVLATTFASDDIGHQGFILGAALSALGVVMSLPTKIYLTLVLMTHEESTNKNYLRSADAQALRKDSVAHIRTATEDDAERLAALAQQTFIEAFGEANSTENMNAYCASHFSPTLQLAEINDQQGLTLIATHEGHLIGFVQLRFGSSPASVPATSPAEIQRLYVLANWHGRGVAHDLMRTALQRIEQAHHDMVWLGVWEHNPRAIAFYKKYQFSEVGEQVFQLGDDAQRDVIMARPVTKQSKK